jgi:hypothetical protein
MAPNPMSFADWHRLGPRGAAGAKTPKTILRAGFGIFYDRFSLSNTLTAARYKGTVQQQYIIENPAFVTTVPPIPSLARIPPASQSIREVDSHLRAPYLFQSAFTSKGGCGGEARSRRQDRARPQRRRTDFPQPGVQRGRQRCAYSFPQIRSSSGAGNPRFVNVDIGTSKTIKISVGKKP